MIIGPLVRLTTRTYVPSVTKILKMVKKSVQDRSTQNGEALRRQVHSTFSDGY
jgi:hypothetical protein